MLLRARKTVIILGAGVLCASVEDCPGTALGALIGALRTASARRPVFMRCSPLVLLVGRQYESP